MLRSLPLAHWPAADASAWLDSCRPGQRLQRGGPAAHLKPITRSDLERRYGYFLTYLVEQGELDSDASPGQQITPYTVDGYLGHVGKIWRSVTIAQTILKLVRMAGLLAPAANWGWLRELANDLELVARPKPRFDRIVSSGRLAQVGFEAIELAHGDVHLMTCRRAKRVRDGLMVALLAHAPIRLKNFANLILGESFRRVGDRWWIVLPGRDTKTSRPDERPLPKHLNPAVAMYLTCARPVLLGREDFVIDDVTQAGQSGLLSGPLWLATGSKPLGYSGVERAIMDTTRYTLGRAISPHDFRRNGATTARLQAGTEPHLASGLLQHRAEEVTENYNLASSLEASDRFAELVSAVERA